jgi:outer membrane protein OmpA-like peptidoglycan-associated protein
MKMNLLTTKIFFIVIVLLSVNLLIGCAGRVFAPKNGVWYYHKEMVDAEKALEAARKAGKDKKCPKEFNAVKDMNDTANEIYRACRTKEGIELAKDVTKNAKALCRVIDRMTLTANFDFDRSDIRGSDIEKLKRAVKFVKKYPGFKIKIEGYTCSIGTEKYNRGLSERRANAVKNYLVKEGRIDAKRITTIGYGESDPVASNNTKEGRAKNRRVEILILAD